MINFPYGQEIKKVIEKDINFITEEKIRMEDGVNISVKIWLPANVNERTPTILMLTPYISDEGHNYGMFFAIRGYAFVCADCRGRGNSEGWFYPMENDGKDGAEIVEWIAKQDWCNGQVAMMGGSYRGMVQWQTLMHFPPSLKTIVPTCSVGPGIDYPQPGNIFYSFMARWLSLVDGKTGNRPLFSDGSYWANKFYKMHKEYIPFSKLDKLCGCRSEIFQRWLAHPDYDEYWKRMVPQKSDYEKINIPILTITGYFDDDQPGAMSYYLNHMKFGNKESLQNHYLLIGPYDHEGTRFPQKQLGGLNFGDNCIIDMLQLHLEWFDWILKGKDKPNFLKDRIIYYLMGENIWKTANSIDGMANNKYKLFLSSKAKNPSIEKAKGLSEKQENDRDDSYYIYNPKDIIPQNKYFEVKSDFLTDQYDAHLNNSIVFETEPLSEPIEISGYIKFFAFMQIDAPDTDFNVNLYEIQRDYSSIFLTGDMMRARYRNSSSKPKLLNPDEICLYEFKNFYIFSRKVQKGSRLRLVISPLNSPDFQKNYNSGGCIADESINVGREVKVKIFHNAKYPSYLEIPIMKT